MALHELGISIAKKALLGRLRLTRPSRTALVLRWRSLLTYLEGFEKYPEYNIDTEGACSSCLGLVQLTLEKLKSLDE